MMSIRRDLEGEVIDGVQWSPRTRDFLSGRSFLVEQD